MLVSHGPAGSLLICAPLLSVGAVFIYRYSLQRRVVINLLRLCDNLKKSR